MVIRRLAGTSRLPTSRRVSGANPALALRAHEIGHAAGEHGQQVRSSAARKRSAIVRMKRSVIVRMKRNVIETTKRREIEKMKRGASESESESDRERMKRSEIGSVTEKMRKSAIESATGVVAEKMTGNAIEIEIATGVVTEKMKRSVIVALHAATDGIGTVIAVQLRRQGQTKPQRLRLPCQRMIQGGKRRPQAPNRRHQRDRTQGPTTPCGSRVLRRHARRRPLPSARIPS
mmetsp:Transcript_156084/g.276835  ORF Transcript_156084/g.276835 Transcript_156084/m.276835 type:complete len:233 (-) Transcript_156084:4373-5071(-)